MKKEITKILHKHDIFTDKVDKLCYNIIKGLFMAEPVDYRKLWKLMIDKGIKNKTELIPMANISSNILAKLNKGEYVSLESLQKICKALNCDIGDVCVVNEI